MLQPKVICLSGNATVGKDKFASLLKEILEERNQKVLLQSIASTIRAEVDDLLQKSLGISAFTTEPTEKAKIRPFLAFWGMDFRRRDDPNVWVKELVRKISEEKNCNYHIVTDIRFMNEIEELKRAAECITIHIDRIDKAGRYIQPANQYEEKNNAILLEKAEFNFIWSTIEDNDILKSNVKHYYETNIQRDRVLQ